MTKLAPIEELAKQVGLMDNEGNLLVHCEPSEKENRELDADILKSFRQAIISDFVSTLEPKWFHHEESGEHIFMNIVFGLPDETPLYDLSEWKTK